MFLRRTIPLLSFFSFHLVYPSPCPTAEAATLLSIRREGYVEHFILKERDNWKVKKVSRWLRNSLERKKKKTRFPLRKEATSSQHRKKGGEVSMTIDSKKKTKKSKNPFPVFYPVPLIHQDWISLENPIYPLEWIMCYDKEMLELKTIAQAFQC